MTVKIKNASYCGTTQQPLAIYTGDHSLYWLDMGTHMVSKTTAMISMHFPNIKVTHIPEGKTFIASDGRIWVMGKNHIEEHVISLRCSILSK